MQTPSRAVNAVPWSMQAMVPACDEGAVRRRFMQLHGRRHQGKAVEQPCQNKQSAQAVVGGMRYAGRCGTACESCVERKKGPALSERSEFA